MLPLVEASVSMRLLLDTHVLVRSSLAPDDLPRRVQDALRDINNDILVSAASAYEIEYKRRRDDELQRLPTDLNAIIEAQKFLWLWLSWEDARDAGLLPPHHRDPFDRILIAQAARQGAVLVTTDRRIPAYGYPTFW